MVAGCAPRAGWVENQLLQNGASGVVARLRWRVMRIPCCTRRSRNAECWAAANSAKAIASAGLGGTCNWNEFDAAVSGLNRNWTGSIMRTCEAVADHGLESAASSERRQWPPLHPVQRLRHIVDMDNLTHTLVGATLGRAGLAGRTRGGMAALMIGANIPDLDVLGLPFGMNLGFRRGITHGIPALLVWPVVVSALLHGVVPRATPSR